ncbi:MAG TPA: hypothetical protein VKE69_13585, partial [Planctomycetota bacterium]|nr:hypothetical protein [Planctomycetota bacterium]
QDVQAALAEEQRLAAQPVAAPPETISGAEVARLASETERARIAASELDAAINASERLLAGGDVRQRDAARSDLGEIDRLQRELDIGRSSLGPKAAALERERLSLRRDLDRRSLLLLERRAFQAQTLVEVERVDRDAKKLAVDRLSRQLEEAVRALATRVESDVREAKRRVASVEAQRAAATSPWDEARLDLDVEAARARADAQQQRLATVRAMVDPALSARLADVRSRLAQLRQQFGADGGSAGDVDPIDAYLAIEEMRRSKAIHDFEDELSDLGDVESTARDEATDARRRSRTLSTSLEVRRNAAVAQLERAIAKGEAPAGAMAAFEAAWSASAAALAEAIQAKARAATRLAEVTGMRERSIRELLDTLSEAESFVRSKGFFLRVGSQVRLQNLRDALLDAVAIVRDLPRFTEQSVSATGTFLTDRSNFWLVAIGAVLLPVAIVLVLFTRRVALRLAAVPVAAEPTLVDRARLLGVETARRAAGIAFSALAVVAATHLFFSHRMPALVRAVDAAAVVVVLVRVARVAIYALFRPDAPSLRLVPASDGTARYVWRIVSLASWAVLAVDVPRSVLAALGYKARNSGFMELLGRVEQGLLVAAVVLFFLRQSVLDDLLPHGRPGPWRLARRFVLQLRPAALFFAIAVFVLSLLGYRFLADYLESISLGGVAIVVLTSLGPVAALAGDSLAARIVLLVAGLALMG